MRYRWLLLGLCTCALVAACVISTDTHGRLVDRSSIQGTAVSTPVKAHLIDGGVIVFPLGSVVDRTTISGQGYRYAVARSTTRVPSDGIALDSVLGLEVYERTINPGRTLVYTPLAVAGGVAGAAVGAAVSAALLAAIFGSCPMIYGDSAGVETLQAESFSYSIAPLLAKRDVDRMTVSPDDRGFIRLAVRNEALETHHLDQMEIVEVSHGPDELALPSPRGGPVAVADITRGAQVLDAAGRDASALVERPDDRAFASDARLLQAAVDGGPVQDRLELVVPRPSGDSRPALVLKARSSLLSTSILYEHLMGAQGAHALDWMGEGLSEISTLARLAGWYGGNFGLRVEVQDGSDWRPVIRLMDFGPTAWRWVGVPLPTDIAGDSLRIRLTFPVDAYRIDWVGVAQRSHPAQQRIVPIARALDHAGEQRADIVEALRDADDRDLETHPGDQFWLEFDAGSSRDANRTFLFAAQGYYVEWLRPGWMKKDGAQPFAPERTTMRDLLRTWQGGRDSLEAVFFERRVPVL